MAYDPKAIQNALLATQRSKTSYGGGKPKTASAAPMMSGDFSAKPTLPTTSNEPKVPNKPKTPSQKPVTAAPTETQSTGFGFSSQNTNGTKVSDLGLQTGYDTPAWYTDEWDRQRQNAQQYAKAGIQYELKADPVTGLPSITYAHGQNLGAIDADPTGGTYDYYGYSNNPNFLQATIGLTRDQVNQNELLAGLSDRALYEIYNQGRQEYNPITGGTFEHGGLYGNLYWNPYNGTGFGGGGISSVNGEGAVSVTDVRKALAELTRQKATYAEDLGGWWGGTLTPFVKPDYYGDNTQLGARQQAEVIDPFVQKILSSRNDTNDMQGSVSTATPSKPTNNIVQTILRKNRELEENERKYKEGY